MKVINIEPKDIYVTFEIPVTKIQHILDYLSAAKLNRKADGVPTDITTTADDYVQKVFFEELRKVYDHVKEKK